MNEPVRILQWGMGPNLGGVDCLMMDIYTYRPIQGAVRFPMRS